MNTEWALAELDKFIGQTVIRNGSGNGFITTQNVTSAPNGRVTEQAQVVEKILDRVLSDWRELDISNASNRWKKHRAAAIRAKEELVRDTEIRQNLGDNAPEISAANLRPWVWSGASSLWQSGHYRDAVEGAAKKLNAEAQNKIGRRDVSEADLFRQPFSLDAPTAGKSRLRRMANDGSKTYESVQRGAMSLAEGVYAGIRNPLSDLPEQQALEYLAPLSVLARWVDKSTVESAT